MKEIQYKDFSLKAHKKNWKLNKPNVCQFELTFNCDLHCLYCYSDCYNNSAYIKNELSTKDVKIILDKIYEAGCLWVCFTGGDPLKRDDFLEIYDYAKQKGFIITIFTNGYSLTKRIADALKDKPPFVVEMTLNSVTKETFEEITQVNASYERTFEGLNMLVERKIPLKIKTMVIKNNLKELPKIRKFIVGLGLRFNPSYFINARLNGDIFPCSLRINLDDLTEGLGNPQMRHLISSKEKSELDIDSLKDSDCLYNQAEDNGNKRYNNRLFRCAAGNSDGIHIDPRGKMSFCSCLREPSLDLLKHDIQKATFQFFSQMSQKTFTNSSPCRRCRIRDACYSCPGYAFLEKGDMESPIDWFCQLAHLVAGYRLQATSHRLQDTRFRREDAEL